MATSMETDAVKEKSNALMKQPDADPSNSDKKKGFLWSRNKPDKPNTISKDEDEPEKIEAGVDKPTLPPVSLFQLYRFNTKFEIFMNIVGLFCAICSGATQPLMTFVFGNLALAFVNFGKALQGVLQNNDAAAQANLKDAANAFKKSAAKDASYLVYIGVGMFVTTYTFMVIWNQNAERAAKRMREQYLQAVLRQDIAFFDNVGAGEVATRIQNDTGLVQLGISEKVPLVLSLISTFFTGYIISFIRSWKLALACASILPFVIIAGGIMSFFLTKLKMAQINHVAQAGTVAEEVISTIRTAQAFGAQSSLERLYNEYIDKMHAIDFKISIAHSGGVSVFFFVIYGAYALAFSFGATLVLRGEGNIGIILNVLIAITMGSMSLAMLAPEAIAIFHARAAAAKLFDTIDRVPPIDSASPDGLKPDPNTIEGQITFHDVRFNYPSRPDVPVLQGVDLSFPAGRRVALVGASGSGKSTVIALVERFYDPSSGSVHLDGIDIRDFNVKWLRRQIGLVSQEPVLFSTTIRKNVEYGLIGTNAEDLPEEEKMARVKEACIKANADGFINALPDGYNTLVGERGFLLSGGQKQRVAIARAIVSDPKVLLLDEATSALDTQSEGVVQNALDKASEGRTTIIVAHRLSTIKDVERIYVMGDGSVLEMGTHNELLQNSEGPYARLVRAQKLKGSEYVEDMPHSDAYAPIEGSSKVVEKEREELDEKKLARVDTSKSMTSEILKHKGFEKSPDEEESGIFYIMGRMAKINRQSWRFYVIGFSAALVTGMAYPVFGIIFGRLVQDFQYTGHELRVQADRGALWFFMIGILASIAYIFQDISFQRTAGDLSHRIRTLVFRSLLRHDIGYFDEEEHSTGSLTSGLSQNPERIAGLAGVTLGTIIQSLVTIVGGSIIGLCYGWKLALVGIACIPFVISTGYVRLRVVVMKDKKNKRDHEESAQIACEAAASIRTVASLTREEDCVRLYSTSLEKPLRIAYKSAFNSTIYFSLSQSMVFFVIALVFWYGSHLVASLEYSTVDFFVCLMSVTFGSVQAGNVFTFVPDISQSHLAGASVIKLLDYHPEIDSESAEGRTISDVEGRVELKHVHFRYPTRLDVRVLRDFNLTVEPGTHIALVGPSGCGKSTVIQLVERFYDPISGSILVDGNKVDELNVQEYRKHLALVSQEPTLYAGTIKFNVLLGATKPVEEVTQEEIEAACRDANILDFIQSLPDGFETQVGGKGSQLSGGQKQRIAIARALLRNPSVLLLDEATSALDSNSEHVVQDALDRAAKGRTTISIAHRLSSIQKCDLIHFMSEGRIVESGTHDELLQRRGKYYEYVLLQDLSGQRAV